MKREIFNSYLKSVLVEFGLTIDELVSRTKKRKISDARQILWYLCKKRNMASTEILEYMEDMNYSTTHASISHAVNVISERMVNDRDYRQIVLKIKDAE